MAQWYVKELSKLTGVSTQTLHHYDRIDLLKPSDRLLNGYRIYSEKDLLRLQQIIALKYFGFDLNQIKALLAGSSGAIEHFRAQAQLLEHKAMNMLDAADTLKHIVADIDDDKSISWETLIKMIEVYRMTQQLEHAWVKDILTHDELKEYVAFENELKSQATPEQKAAFEKSWSILVEELKENLNEDPASPIGIALGKKCMDWINGVYGKKYAHLRTKKFEKGFAQGKGLAEVGLTSEIVSWMDKAIDAYWQYRIDGILTQVGTGQSDEKTLQSWEQLLDEMYGENEARKKEILDIHLENHKISRQGKL